VYNSVFFSSVMEGGMVLEYKHFARVLIPGIVVIRNRVHTSHQVGGVTGVQIPFFRCVFAGTNVTHGAALCRHPVGAGETFLANLVKAGFTDFRVGHTFGIRAIPRGTTRIQGDARQLQ